MSFLVDRHLSRKRAIKMLTGPLARRWCKTTWDLLYTGRYAKRKPGLNKGQDCCPCITLHIPLFLYVQLGVYKLILKNKVFGVLHRCWASPCRSFLPFFNWIPIWSREAHHIYLLALTSKIRERGSLRWGILRYLRGRLRPYIDGVSALFRGFIGFLWKPRNTASFSPLFSLLSLTTVFFPNLSLYL